MNIRMIAGLAGGLVGAAAAGMAVHSLFDSPIERIRLGYNSGSAITAYTVGTLAIIGGFNAGVGLVAGSFATKDSIQLQREIIKASYAEQQARQDTSEA